MRILYEGPHYQHPEDFIKINEKDQLYPLQANKGQVVKYGEKEYKLLDVFEKKYDMFNRFSLLLSAIAHAFFSFMDNSYWNQAATDFGNFMYGREIVVVYKEENQAGSQPERIATVSRSAMGEHVIAGPGILQDLHQAEAPAVPLEQGFVPLNEKVRTGIVIQKIGNEPNTVDVNQITVLDQRLLPHGFSKCGYHALKNGVATLGLISGALRDSNVFQDVIFYQAFEALIDQFKLQEGGVREGDASIHILKKVWEHLISNDPLPVELTDQHKAIIETVRLACRAHKTELSMFNYSGSLFVDGREIFDPTVAIRNFTEGMVNVDRIAHTEQNAFLENFKRIQEELQMPDTPFRHVFLMGTHGHWCTVILERNEAGNLNWYGLDSYITDLENPLKYLSTHVQALGSGLQNGAFAREAYIHNRPVFEV